MGIVVVGLGPGPYRALTLEAVEALHSATELYLRTREHPVVAELPPGLRWTSFDALYEQAGSFEALYEQIATILLERGAQTEVTYAVPGHPLLGEASVRRLLERAPAAGVPLRLVGGLSFLEAVLAASGTPGLDHVQVVDALALPPLVPTVPLVVYQVYKAAVASDVKLALLRRYPPDHPVVVIRGAATSGEVVRQVPLAELDRGLAFDHLTSLYVPPLAPEADFGTFDGLVRLVARLRGPGGCPWDAQQTHASIKRYVLEEAYEVAEAIDDEDYPALCDELGDLLLQVVLHAQMADERGEFDIIDVLQSICAKLVRRHPHVFGSTTVADAAEVERNWEEIKRRERGAPAAPASLLNDLPRHRPALVLAQAIWQRLMRAGLAPSRSEALSRAQDALAALERVTEPAARASSLGELLFALAALASLEALDAEEALRQASRRFLQRFRALEARLGASGRDLAALAPEEYRALWATGEPA
jgi:tetrapyrrole methylase family protein/MazG family protein